MQNKPSLLYSRLISAIGWLGAQTKGEYQVDSNKHYVIINNRAYDPITGLPVDQIHAAQPAEAAPAITNVQPNRGLSSAGRTTQRSETLSRRYVKRPSLQPVGSAQPEPIVAAYSPVNLAAMNAKQSESIKKFAPAPQSIDINQKRADLPADKHPMAQRIAQQQAAASIQRQRANAQQKQSLEVRSNHQNSVQPKELKSAAVLKNEAILEAMNREIAPQKSVRAKKQRKSNRWSRFMGMATASLAIVMLAGYFTYLNMPNLNMRMAAIQSGIDARYPGYSPDGYALNGPIQFKDGEVAMKFAYADGAQGYTLTQQKSNWDSSAVKQYVDSQSDSAIATQVDGLTIFTYQGSAAWVNRGILYTVNGSAPLSSDQIQRIATSM